MRLSFFAPLTGMLAMAFMLLVQAPQSAAVSATTGICGGATCLPQEAQSQDSKLDQQLPLQRLAKFKLKLSIDCPHGFFWDGETCLQERRHKRFECPGGSQWNGDQCVRDRKGKKKGGGGCVGAFHWNGHQCVPDGQGNKKNKGKSEFPPIEGQEGGDGFSCSHNDHLENGRCVPCKQGFHVEGDECVAD